MSRLHWTAWLGAAWLGSAVSAFAATPVIYTVPPSVDPQALCNDDTPPVFWVRPGAAGVTTWIIWFEGGGDCFDTISCTKRAAGNEAHLTTSTGFTATEGASGLLSASATVNPTLSNANAVLLHYCSSDTWAGDRVSNGQKFVGGNTNTWYFEGKRIAIAQIRELLAVTNNLNGATKILLGGTSAGGEGVTINANDVMPLLPSNAQMLFVNDAGFALDIGAFDANAAPTYVSTASPTAFEREIQARLALWNGRGDTKCDKDATTDLQRGKCYDSGYVLRNGYITAPSFVAESQLDTAQIHQELCPPYGCNVSTNPASPKGIYATNFASAMAALITAANTPATFTGYSPDVYFHVALECDGVLNGTFSFNGPNGGTQMLSTQNVFSAWFANPAAPRAVYIGNAPGVGPLNPAYCNKTQG